MTKDAPGQSPGPAVSRSDYSGLIVAGLALAGVVLLLVADLAIHAYLDRIESAALLVGRAAPPEGQRR
jgi:hypothetical protein